MGSNSLNMHSNPQKTEFILRAMTYNIHSCIGMDKKVDLERIARVIGHAAPDIVALQEVDNGLPRTYHQDQAGMLADMLDMKSFFFPLVKNGRQEYGLAVLSRFTCTDVQYDCLPKLDSKLKFNLEPRGCMQMSFQTPAGTVVSINTHLSLYWLERQLQMNSLTGTECLAGLPPASAVIFCGDLNAGFPSPVYRRLSRVLSDVQKGLQNRSRPRATFPARRPLIRLDHIFVSSRFEILEVLVPRTADTRLASDHLPVVADLELCQG